MFVGIGCRVRFRDNQCRPEARKGGGRLCWWEEQETHKNIDNAWPAVIAWLDLLNIRIWKEHFRGKVGLTIPSLHVSPRVPSSRTFLPRGSRRTWKATAVCPPYMHWGDRRYCAVVGTAIWSLIFETPASITSLRARYCNSDDGIPTGIRYQGNAAFEITLSGGKPIIIKNLT